MSLIMGKQFLCYSVILNVAERSEESLFCPHSEAPPKNLVVNVLCGEEDQAGDVSLCST